MKTHYTVERNIQVIISLLKAHGIKKVIASPGTTHISFLGSIQNDPYFEIYSSVDERSAAYMACGMAAAGKEPVVITCTGATASRNYIPGITEAYYRKLPIVALTGTQHKGKIGQNVAQVIDRTKELNDTFKSVVQVPIIHSDADEEMCSVQVNEALLELTHNGGGPVLINFESTYNNDFSVKELPTVHVINRVCYNDQFPKLKNKNVAIFVGAHLEWDNELTDEVDKFCERYNGVVLCDQTSNYHGKYGISAALLQSQMNYKANCSNVDLLIDIGDVSGAYYDVHPSNVWRVNPDGKIRERNHKINYVFEMEEIYFFKKYNELSNESNISFYNEWSNEDEEIRSLITNLPFSNVWIAQQLCDKLPEKSIVYLGILNTLRSWNLTQILKNNYVLCNTGGFGIDGNMSSALGASLVDQNKLCFLFLGDLAFFYDMNSIGNRCLGNNLRIMLINNGCGTEFRNFNHRAKRTFGEDADLFMAAAGHFGNQSKELVKNYAQNLGLEYFSATNKEEFNENVKKFIDPQIGDKSIIFEVFTNSNDESDAIKNMYSLKVNKKNLLKNKVKQIVGEAKIKKIKSVIKK